MKYQGLLATISRSALILSLGVSGSSVEGNGNFSCADLTYYTQDPTALDTFVTSQVQQYDNEPIYFKIPSGPAPYRYCLSDIRIPDVIGGTRCNPPDGGASNGDDRCMLLIGIHALDGETNPPTIQVGGVDGEQTTLSQVFDHAGYDCLCQGYSFYEDVANATFGSGACGIKDFNEWAVTCPPVEGGDTTTMSIVISACPDRPDLNGCNVCKGGSALGPITVGLQWILNTEEQCIEHAFKTSGAPIMASISVVVFQAIMSLLILT